MDATELPPADDEIKDASELTDDDLEVVVGGLSVWISLPGEDTAPER